MRVARDGAGAAHHHGRRRRLRRRRGGALVAGGAGERVAVGRRRVVVLAGVGEDEGVGVRAAALHLLPRRTPLGAAAPVVSPVRSRNRAAGGEIAPTPARS